ncbi:LOW QUALITY PROTEIN: uncharacterized protein LOC108680470 [Hyalella azteca]|uniref:LOW QUALITY PROTEIN: uncharacterized protein LOC108680470 n=1 Tax=Hyalella azteca TaxID=294128 RepID=A0A8B7PHI2_HYAAZ|nr:LOW QUALITY PROTEIN: uncharacterized protein LOC108680470 [Hyalella azteca]
MLRLALVTVLWGTLVATHPQYGPPVEQLEQVAGAPVAPTGDEKEDYWWRQEGVFTNTGKHPATATGGAAFTPQQSQLCGAGSDCVPWGTCIDGYIDTSGAGQIDLRKPGTKPPASLGYTECGALGNVCCLLPGGSGIISGGGGIVSGGGGIVSGGGGIVSGGGGIVSGGGGGDGHGGKQTGPPYPACSAGLLCIEENLCNLFTGFIGPRIPLFEGQKFIDYKHCTTGSLAVGVCCQEESEGGIGKGGGTGGGGIGGGGIGGGGIGDGGIGVWCIGGGIGSGGGGIGGVGGIGGGGSAALLTGCSVHEDCVAAIQCHNGVINTGGEGLIDLRKKPDYRKCHNAEYPEVESVCCRLPDAPPVAKSCPDFSICTDRDYCDLNGFIVTNSIKGSFYGGTDCYTNAAVSLNVGVCCKPAPARSITCPANSVCIPEDFCFGDILESAGSFTAYSPGGTWSACGLPDNSGSGVCCSNPPPDIGPIPQQCGVSRYGTQDDSLKTRIHVPKLDKLEADFGELPWQAIVFFSNYTFKCGATLISDKYLLTVAHCVKGLKPYDVRIRLGEWQVNTFTEPYPYQDVEVSKIIVHPEYTDGSHWNNIAILELATPVKLEYNINNVCLPFGSGPIPAGTRCLVSGWGKDSFAGNYQHILKKIDVPLVDHHRCQELLRYTRLGKYFRLHDSYRCAGGEYGKDACVGDGGGPLICFDEGSKSYVAVGLTAWGIGCGEKDVPGAYTDLAKFTPWIASVTGLGHSENINVGYGK